VLPHVGRDGVYIESHRIGNPWFERMPMLIFKSAHQPIGYLLAVSVAVLTLAAPALDAPAPLVEEHTHSSKVFQEEKGYRVYLPATYQTGKTRYPLLYWFHGHFGSYKQNTYRKD